MPNISDIRKKQSESRHLKSDFRIGFTLIELLVVITIIAILIGVGTVSYTNAQQKSRDGKRKSDLKAVQQALELYFQQKGQYPPIDWAGWCARISSTAAPEVRNALEGPPTYISKVPKDPTLANKNGDYLYYRTGASTYELYSIVENTNDPDRNSTAYDFGFCVDGYSDYRYKVTNP